MPLSLRRAPNWRRTRDQTLSEPDGPRGSDTLFASSRQKHVLLKGGIAELQQKSSFGASAQPSKNMVFALGFSNSVGDHKAKSGSLEAFWRNPGPKSLHCIGQLTETVRHNRKRPCAQQALLRGILHVQIRQKDNTFLIKQGISPH